MFDNTTELGEFFITDKQSGFTLDNNNNIIRSNNKLVINNFNTDNKLKLLWNNDITQNLTLRLFPMYHHNDDLFDYINTLSERKFHFAILKRKNIRDQLLSFIIAHFNIEGIKKESFTINYSPKKVFVDIKKIEPYISLFLENANKHDNWIKSLLTNSNTLYYNVYYETLVTDLEKTYGKKNMYIGNKSINGDPYDYIINRHEVHSFLQQLAIVD